VIGGVYVHADSPIHTLRPGIKLLALVALSTAIVLVADVRVVLAGLVVTVALYRLAGLPLALCWTQIRPLLPIIAILGVVQFFTTDIFGAVLVVARLSMLVLLASLVSITTRVSDMIDTIGRATQPLAYLGISPTRIGLTISLALRFIPLIAEQLEEVREAQRARGLERSFHALIIPLMVRTLKMATEIGDAIEARSFDPDDAKSPRDLIALLRRKQ